MTGPGRHYTPVQDRVAGGAFDPPDARYRDQHNPPVADDDGEGLSLDFDLSASVEWGGRLDRLGKSIDKLGNLADALFDMHAIPLNLRNSTIVPSSGPAQITMGGPRVGRFWEVTALVVVGTDDHTVLTGTEVAFYVGNADTPTVLDVVLPGSQGGAGVTVPANAQFGRRQIVVQATEKAFYLINGATPGQVLNAGLIGWDRDVLDYPVRT